MEVGLQNGVFPSRERLRELWNKRTRTQENTFLTMRGRGEKSLLKMGGSGKRKKKVVTRVSFGLRLSKPDVLTWLDTKEREREIT